MLSVTVVTLPQRSSPRVNAYSIILPFNRSARHSPPGMAGHTFLPIVAAPRASIPHPRFAALACHGDVTGQESFDVIGFRLERVLADQWACASGSPVSRVASLCPALVETLRRWWNMNLNMMTEIYQRGGRDELIRAIEHFSRTTKAEMLAATSVALPRADVDDLKRKAAAGASDADSTSY